MGILGDHLGPSPEAPDLPDSHDRAADSRTGLAESAKLDQIPSNFGQPYIFTNKVAFLIYFTKIFLNSGTIMLLENNQVIL